MNHSDFFIQCQRVLARVENGNFPKERDMAEQPFADLTRRLRTASIDWQYRSVRQRLAPVRVPASAACRSTGFLN